MPNAIQIELLRAGIEYNGAALASGKVYTYAAGTTNNKNTYTDAAKTTPAANPIILDSNGRAVVFGDGVYKFVIKTSADATLYTWDNLTYFSQAEDVGMYDALDYGANDFTQATIEAAITAIAGASRTLLLRPGSWNISSTLTIPANINLKVERGALLTKSATGTVVFNGILEAGLYQIFSGFAAAEITGLKEAYPVWWGAVGDGVADDTVELDSAIYAVKTKFGIVYVPANTSYKITAVMNYSGITIRGANRVYSKIFIDYAGVGLLTESSSVQSVLENLTIGGTLSFAWANNPVTGKIGVHIKTAHNHIIRNCYLFALDTGIKITGGGYHGITEGNTFRRNNISVHLLGDGTGPPNSQSILYNQIDAYPVSEGGRGTTVGIKADGTTAVITGLRIIGNGIENANIGVQLIYANNTSLISNYAENSVTEYTYTNSTNIFELTMSGAASLKITMPTITQEEPTANALYKFSRSGVWHGQIGVNTANEFILQANTQPVKMSIDGGASVQLHIDTAGNVGLAGITAGNDASPPGISDGPGVHIAGKILRLDSSKTPATAAAAGNTGEMCWDSSYFYICTAANTWRRIAHNTW